MLGTIKQKYTNLISDRKFSEIFTGSAWALSGLLLATGLGLISSIIIARFYGAEVLGIVAVINSFLMLVTIVTLLGTNTSILRLIPEHLIRYSASSAFRVYRKMQYLVIGISLVISALFFLSSTLISDKVFNKPHLSFYLSIASFFVVFKSLMLLNTQAVRGLKLIRVFTIMQVLPQGFNLMLLLVLGLVLSNSDVPVYAMLGSFVLTGLLGWVIMEQAFKARMQPKDIVHSLPTREILSTSVPMLMTAAMNFVIGQSGVIILGIFHSEADVGYYAVAVKLATLTVFILSAINSLAGPKFSELFHSGKIDELFYVAKKSAKLIFWTTTPVLLLFAILGKPILRIFFSHEFIAAYPALVILVIGQFVHSISGATGLFMNMTGNHKAYTKITLIVALSNIGLNLILIPELGINGAAIAGMLSLAGWNSTILIYIKGKYEMTTGYFPTLTRRWRGDRV